MAVALLDAKLDRERKSLSIVWKPTSKLRIDEGFRAIERGVVWLQTAASGDAVVPVTAGRVGTRASGDNEKPAAAARAAPRREGAARIPKALDRHSEQDRRRLDQAVSGN